MRGKQHLSDLAAFGGSKLFFETLPVEKPYIPDWKDFEDAFYNIFKRRFFSNNGPLVRELDSHFAEYLGVGNAISVTNGTIALMMAAKALDLKGDVILPAFTLHGTAQALYWAGLTPVFCDVSLSSQTLTVKLIEPLINTRTCAILGVHLWGRACDPYKLQDLCESRDLALFFDAAHAIDCSYQGVKIGGFGQIEAFSFQATNIFNGAGGGCLTTNDDELANRLRTMRNFHVSESIDEVPFRINGKMSEAQAAMTLLSLKNLKKNIRHNKKLYNLYKQRSLNWQGLQMVDNVGDEDSNYQYAVFKINSELLNMKRDQLLVLLQSEGICAESLSQLGVHRTPLYQKLYPQYKDQLPATDILSSSLLRLPIGTNINPDDVIKISDLIDFLIGHDTEIVEYFLKKQA